jgi:hypothetical protein
MMEIVWPSAGRALELLRGANVHLNGVNLSSLTSGLVRRKRSADESLNEPQARQGLPLSYDYPSGSFPSQPRYPSGIQSLPSQPVPPYWSDGLPFSNPLSTSALPQVYSTGLVEEQRSTFENPTLRQNTLQSQQRLPYSPYWNDYSTYSQLGIPYPPFQEVQTRGSSYIPEHFDNNNLNTQCSSTCL